MSNGISYMKTRREMINPLKGLLTKGVIESRLQIRKGFQTSLDSSPLKVAHTIFDGASKIQNYSPPILIQHGLLGSKKNWTSLAKAIHLKTGIKVITSDARNHGDSPHSHVFNYEVLSNDIELLMNDLNISKANLIGHSMGGRAVMRVALKKPSLVDKLVVVDISPYKISPGAQSMSSYLTAMKNADLESSPSFPALRKSVDKQLESVVKDNLVRQFILTNLLEQRGQYKWRVNLDSIIKNLPQIVGHSPFTGIYHGPTLFIAGEKSDYIKPEDHDIIQQMFPNSKFKYIKNAGHWVHSEKPTEFLETLYEFLSS